MKLISVKGTRKKVKVDDDVFELFGMLPWRYLKGNKGSRHIRCWFRGRNVDLHRLILGLSEGDGKIADHINRDIFDDRRKNLRVCDRFQNMQNRGPQKNNTSGFKGVQLKGGTWVALIRVRGKDKYLGSFRDRFEAAKSYNKAAKKYFGRFAWLNPI